MQEVQLKENTCVLRKRKKGRREEKKREEKRREEKDPRTEGTDTLACVRDG